MFLNVFLYSQIDVFYNYGLRHNFGSCLPILKVLTLLGSTINLQQGRAIFPTALFCETCAADTFDFQQVMY